MTSRNTLEDLSFAEMHLDYMSRRSTSQQTRAEAQTLMGIIRLLDYHQPSWREQLLAELSSKDLHRQVEEILGGSLDFISLMEEYLSSLINIKDIKSE